jgi:hypothetical protein
MRHDSYGPLVGWGLAALLLGAGSAQARAFDVTINISNPSLSAGPALLVFDLVDGELGPPVNKVELSEVTSDGTQVSTHVDGDITGTGPWIFSTASDFIINELQILFDPLGTTMSFSFTTTDNPPLGGFPDAFSFFILNSDQSAFLITTNDPVEGENALFVYNIGGGTEGLSVFTPDQSGFSFSVTPVQAAPEPASLALLAVGLVALLARRRPMSRPHGRFEEGR